jgi:AI-2 transport protein TqsA
MPTPPPAQRVFSDKAIQTNSLAIMAVIAVGFTLHYLQSVLLPFVLAVFFLCGLTPILDLMRKWNVPRPAAIGLTFIVGLLSVVLLWGMIWISVSALIRDSAVYRQRVERIVDYAHATLQPYLPAEFQSGAFAPGASTEPKATNVELESEEAVGAGEKVGATAASPAGENVVKDESLANDVETSAVTTNPGSSMRAYLTAQLQWAVQALSAGLFELMGSGAMIVIFMFFMLAGDGRAKAAQPQIWLEIESRIRDYIVMKTLISFVTGVAVWLVLWFFGIPLALVFGLLAFLLNFIPNIGPMIMCVLPLPLVFLSPQLSLASMLIVTVLLSGIQFISGSLVEPKVMGSSFQLHPVVIMLTLLLWGLIWGLPGMFLSTPITAAMKIIMERFTYTQPFARLLEGTWQATPR